MTSNKEITAYAVSMILKATLFSASWAGNARKRGLKSIAQIRFDKKDKEIFFIDVMDTYINTSY
jgi:hypothetical protein